MNRTNDYLNPDLHIHSCFSDGTDSLEELLDNVRKAKLDLFSLTDHDTAQGCGGMQKLLTPSDARFICGIEFSCEDASGKSHILGYCYDTAKNPITELIDYGHWARREKLRRRLEYLKSNHMVLNEDETAVLYAMTSPGKPHLVNLLLEHHYIADKKEGFAMLKNVKDDDLNLAPEDAVGAILQSDGIPVLAHGILGSGSENLTMEFLDGRVKKLKEAGLMGLESFYSKYTAEQTEIMLRLGEKYNLMATAGSDYHGTNKPVRLGQTNLTQPERLSRFYTAMRLLL